MLDQKQTKLFLELVAKMSSYGQFETKLGMSQRDVETEKARLGIRDRDDAKKMLDEKFSSKVEKLKLDKERLQKQKEAEQRLRELKQNSSDNKLEPDGRYIHQGGGCRSASVAAAALDRLDQDHNEHEVEVPPLESTDNFIHDSRFGISFLTQKYGFTRKEVMALAKKLNLKKLLE